MKRRLIKLLAFLASRVLARERPKIVAVTGSVGKTSAVRAVFAALSKSFRVRRPAKNFNNEIGVPLAILGEEKTGGRSPFAWAAILGRAVLLAFGRTREYPEVLVLEMGADRPGDIAALASLAPPDVAVVTAVGEAHAEYLGGPDGIAREKGMLVEALREDGAAALNADDPRVLAMAGRARGRVIFYGLGEKARVRAEDIRTEQAMGTWFTRFTLVMDGERFDVTLPGAVGRGNVSAALAGAAAALAMGVEPALIPFGLGTYEAPPGRLRPLPGVKGTMLIDDTYNSSPRAAALALELLAALEPGPGGRRIAVLGDMLELGTMTEPGHRETGRLAAELGIDLVVGVGPLSGFLCDEAGKAGMPEERVYHLHSAEEAGHFLQGRIRTGDLLLVKGSQGMRMERVVKELMAEPERASELLVRQERNWK